MLLLHFLKFLLTNPTTKCKKEKDLRKLEILENLKDQNIVKARRKIFEGSQEYPLGEKTNRKDI
jgi:hypothetical protein